MSGSTPTDHHLIHQRQTSIESYHSEVKKPKAERDRMLILNSITIRRLASDREIMGDTGLPINIVCARRNELVEKGLVKDGTTGQNVATGKKVTLWMRTPGQIRLFDDGDKHMSSQKRKKLIYELCKKELEDNAESDLAKKILEILDHK